MRRLVLLLALVLPGGSLAWQTGKTGQDQEQFQSYLKWDRLDPASGDHPGTTPSLVELDPELVWAFDADGEHFHLLILVPGNWDEASDLYLAVGWFNQVGTVITKDQTVIWKAIWYAVDPTVVQATNHDAAVTVTGTYTELGDPGTDRDLHATIIALDWDNGTQTPTSGGMIHLELSRDMTNDTYGADANVLGLKRGYYRNKL